MDRSISADDWKALSSRVNLEVAILRAVARVESAGDGFVLIQSGWVPKVLFEGHVFHKLTQGRFDKDYPKLSYPKWDRTHYAKTQQGEHERMDAACVLDRVAALQSTSWGAFQIMGFNCAACGFGDVEAFVRAQQSGAAGQLDAFARFIDRPGYLRPLRAKNWAVFAKLYNGPGYAANKYDIKLKQAFDRYVAEEKDAATTRITSGRAMTKPGKADEMPAQGRKTFAPVPPRGPTRRAHPVKPDPVDLRDWIYQPNVARAPAESMMPVFSRLSSDQKNSEACTGFSLATVIEYLLYNRSKTTDPRISGYMLYSMARRYDEWDDDERKDTGSSLRGALKGWSQHGASDEKKWKKLSMPKATVDSEDWWLDAVNRPLGAYYRMSLDVISDIHVALQEVGVIYASAFTHGGWSELSVDTAEPHANSVGDFPLIHYRKGERSGGHAFAIVGYTADGFIIQNSWGTRWGRAGFAVLTYTDWRANAMDCWVCQLGVVTAEHKAVASASSLRFVKSGSGVQDGNVAASGTAGKVLLASNEVLATHEISPFIVDMGNEGRLSDRGLFRTGPDDLESLVSHYFQDACATWGVGKNDTLDIAIYAHGGLVDEKSAAETAKIWVPLLYANKIFPIFLMWETGALQTVLNGIGDLLSRDQERTGGLVQKIKDATLRWIDERIEGLARKPGGTLWRQMKDNAEKMSRLGDSGVMQLFELFRARRKADPSLPKMRLHLIGHSAGSIVHSYLGARATLEKLDIGSINLLAPAVRMDLFEKELGPVIVNGKIPVLLAHLTDAAELDDSTCKPYGHSLLYLVSRSFEDRDETSILGMERYLIPAMVGGEWGSHVRRLPTPGFAYEPGGAPTKATSHGGLDDDPVIQQAVIKHIKGR
ncbi:MAG: N-acetylmuramidase domain-containing protein [Dokdonella sp.]